MKKILTRFSVLSFLCFVTFDQVLFAECSLSTVPSPPIQKWEKNVDALIAGAKKLSGNDTQCAKPK
jgi:hypothetical protein